MKQKVLKVHPQDNVLVALQDLSKGEKILYNGVEYTLLDDVAAKHKFVTADLEKGAAVIMYGVLVGKTTEALPAGSRITTSNLKHASAAYALSETRKEVHSKTENDTSWKDRTFMGYHRSDGCVGTGNYWLVVPLVFCENRNVEVLKDALLEELGYAHPPKYRALTKQLVAAMESGVDVETISLNESAQATAKSPVFKNVDGIKFLSHTGGCGGIRQDAQTLCGLLAGYITHPNVAGATVLSLGCQNAQVAMLKEEIEKRSPSFDKPLYIFEQQTVGRETDLIEFAMKRTFEGLIIANQQTRKPAPISKLVIGLECGGSDGFSGISANPAIGHTSDLLVSAGGSVILSEFPELCGVEQEISDRCSDVRDAERFICLMRAYAASAVAVGSGFDMNPSPGNIKDGLITDAMKSAGAAKKGGTSGVAAVLDYPEVVRRAGLNLLCTPGNDVESTTAEVGAGATVVLFTTGLGTPTGNPIAPVVKISSNTALYNRMPDIIDINAGTIIEGNETIEQCGERILEYVIAVASGEKLVNAVRLSQDDFIPWKRGISL
ncbi:UxaA family hydrolase [Pseudobacter ginsenosidimutans]|uniref:Altronate hydrolase n=1 Tax=Pseudobacter ginsenosidimutans TaxID=661488 RepID=A0A4Q7N333_9BACT|nr:altronate dehydratase family protein [Pseudobacter ginsenosidimutans]QEC43393.1 altronate dehydratase [Pseudobacter ginsenosidimutans]RZS74765.1 altronate hydrolase [Pseudobacter ginsenosidimutans]